ncbi:MAG: hypothetical protein PHU46_12020 [Rhodocyclaceae bacterium]|nr:hypothetical protein [Rhodocyclaceae bacterium]
MKADPTGQPSEQCFARMGWVPAKVAKAAGMKPCQECHSYELVSKHRGGGEFSYLIRCFHPMTFGNREQGQATRENASCKQWNRKEQK